MPELPEVETTVRGIAPHIVGQVVKEVIIRNRHLRRPVSRELAAGLRGQTIRAVRRRAKYLLLIADQGAVLIHLGMSGSLRLVRAHTPPTRHDHLDLVLAGGYSLRLRDPRRFGSVLWTRRDPERHRLLAGLGPEPFSQAFTGDYLYHRSRGRKVPVKTFLMDPRAVAGLGNIYSSEALFRAGIHPRRPAGRISRERYWRLADAVKATLSDAIRAGGTTLRDFRGGDGQPGYFALSLNAYGKQGTPCVCCGTAIRREIIGQRSSFYCPYCQR